MLSKESLKRLGSKLSTNQTYCPDTGIEDVDVGNCLASLGAYPSNSTDELGRERFHPSSLENHFTNNGVAWLNTFAANPLKIVIYL